MDTLISELDTIKINFKICQTKKTKSDSKSIFCLFSLFLPNLD